MLSLTLLLLDEPQYSTAIALAIAVLLINNCSATLTIV